MLTNEEEKFMSWWRQNREQEKTLGRQLRMVLPIGLILGVAIILNFITGWYTRAIMVANSGSTPLVIIIGIIIVALFTSVFYKRHRWEMNEQRYQELEVKQKRDKTAVDMQQQELINGQQGN
jgi:membrane protein YdbS with pleckstrin-like domain